MSRHLWQIISFIIGLSIAPAAEAYWEIGVYFRLHSAIAGIIARAAKGLSQRS